MSPETTRHPSPRPPPRSGEGEQGNPTPRPPPRSGEGEQGNPSPPTPSPKRRGGARQPLPPNPLPEAERGSRQSFSPPLPFGEGVGGGVLIALSLRPPRAGNRQYRAAQPPRRRSAAPS